MYFSLIAVIQNKVWGSQDTSFSIFTLGLTNESASYFMFLHDIIIDLPFKIRNGLCLFDQFREYIAFILLS
jgi:hypothetical protein